MIENNNLETIVENLKKIGVVIAPTYQIYEDLVQQSKIAKTLFSDSPWKTKITSEEAATFYIVSRGITPSRIVSVGAYFGYATFWMHTNLAPNGKSILIDYDCEALKYAERKLLQVNTNLDIACEEFFKVTKELPSEIDCLYLDVDDRKRETTDSLFGKRVNLRILQTCMQNLKQGAIVIAHDTNFDAMQDYVSYVSAPPFESVFLRTKNGVGVSRYG